jgi:hypothetical protein
MPNRVRHERHCVWTARVVVRSYALLLASFLILPASVAQEQLPQHATQERSRLGPDRPATVAQETSAQRFNLPGRGFLVLNVPANWLSIVRQSTTPNTPNTIVFTPREGLLFELSIVPSWQADAVDAQTATRSARETVQRMADEVRPNAVESELPLKMLKGASGTGFYYSATDKSPRSNDYPYLTQGVLNVGRASLSFTLLTHGNRQAVENATIALLKSARFTPQ